MRAGRRGGTLAFSTSASTGTASGGRSACRSWAGAGALAGRLARTTSGSGGNGRRAGRRRSDCSGDFGSDRLLRRDMAQPETQAEIACPAEPGFCEFARSSRLRLHFALRWAGFAWNVPANYRGLVAFRCTCCVQRGGSPGARAGRNGRTSQRLRLLSRGASTASSIALAQLSSRVHFAEQGQLADHGRSHLAGRPPPRDGLRTRAPHLARRAPRAPR